MFGTSRNKFSSFSVSNHLTGMSPSTVNLIFIKFLDLMRYNRLVPYQFNPIVPIDIPLYFFQYLKNGLFILALIFKKVGISEKMRHAVSILPNSIHYFPEYMSISRNPHTILLPLTHT